MNPLPRLTGKERKALDQRTALEAGYATRILREIDAEMAHGRHAEFTPGQRSVLTRVLRKQYAAFCIAVRQEAGRLFAEEEAKLRMELEQSAEPKGESDVG